MIEIDIEKELASGGEGMVLRISLKIEEGSFVALTGPSGSGKTTLLRIIAGLESARGRIEVRGRSWLKEGESLPPQKRDIGFVFQEYALFENMSVEQNLLYIAKDRELADHLLEITDLKGLSKRLPRRLSGGQKQRVALCRALMRRPKILLMDEPLSALDPDMRSRLQHDILTLHREFGTTTIMVSHDPSEIYRLAKRVVSLKEGSITADGTPKDVLLKTGGSQKFSFEGEVLEVVEVDVIRIAVVAIGQQLVEVVLSEEEAKLVEPGKRVRIGTKAFAPTILWQEV